jgi:hypothetical protein
MLIIMMLKVMRLSSKHQVHKIFVSPLVMVLARILELTMMMMMMMMMMKMMQVVRLDQLMELSDS